MDHFSLNLILEISHSNRLASKLSKCAINIQIRYADERVDKMPYLHVTVGGPLFKALRALVRFLSRMYSDVISECARSGESLAANVTSVRSGTLKQYEISKPNIANGVCKIKRVKISQ